MPPLLRLPCALLALLLSALGGPRFAVERPSDSDQPESPVVMALAALPPAQVDLPGEWWWPLPSSLPRLRLVANVAPADIEPVHADPVRAAPGPRHGSAGGPRAP